MHQQNAQRQFRGVKSMRELAEAPAVTAFRARFEAGRSFDLDDDLEFCPNLLTEDDVCYDPRSAIVSLRHAPLEIVGETGVESPREQPC